LRTGALFDVVVCLCIRARPHHRTAQPITCMFSLLRSGVDFGGQKLACSAELLLAVWQVKVGAEHEGGG
jgi:hypothetical protein